MTHHLTIATMREMLTDMPRTSPYERLTLLTLASKGEPQQMSHLTKQVGMSAGALTTVIDRLQKASLVNRIFDQLDRRVSRIQLTTKGAKLVARAESRAGEPAA